jgi:hypothetical protein
VPAPMPPAPSAPGGQGEEPFRHRRVGPWVPVMPAILGPSATGGDTQVIVTSNLADFHYLPEGIEAQSPDEFLCNLFDLDGAGLVELLRDQAAARILSSPIAAGS